jgi:ubiquinone/menaquinone biosynthesis C-methylase UbiE
MPEIPAERIARSYFESEKVVSHYFRDGHRVGLWNSEKLLFSELYSKEERILDLGCGTGRIAFGLEQLGFKNVSAADFSESMILGARQIGEGIGSKVDFHQADARDLPWAGGSFDGVIFGFNGFFMIPGVEERFKALGEIFRVLKPGGRFLFTGHDRSQNNQKRHWTDESTKWKAGEQDKRKTDFGDVIEETGLGTMYIHSAETEETEAQLNRAGFKSVQSWLRRELGNETAEVRAFSDECRFWKAVKVNTVQK